MAMSQDAFISHKMSGAAESIGHATKNRAVVVLGVGRSGTSALTRGLVALAVELETQLRRPTLLKNPTGFFEDTDLLRINKRLKRILGVTGESVRLLEPGWWQRPDVAALHDDAVATINRRFGSYPLWGFKYARTLRFMPFWVQVFADAGTEPRYLMPIRNPLSVARSRARLDPARGSQAQSDLEWLVNVVPYFRMVRERPLVVVDFDLFMTDPASQLTRVAERLDLPADERRQNAIDTYVEQFLNPNLRHSTYGIAELDDAPEINGVTRVAYRWLYRLATDVADPRAAEIWDEWVHIEAAVAEIGPILAHIDGIKTKLRVARWNPLGPLQMLPWLWHELRRRWPTG